MNELGATARMVREGLGALAKAGLAVEAKQGGWLLAREPSRITLAQVRGAARATLRFPAQEADQVSVAIARAYAQAEGAAEATLTESVESLLRRTDGIPVAPVQQLTPEPDPRPLGVGQGAQKPA